MKKSIIYLALICVVSLYVKASCIDDPIIDIISPQEGSTIYNNFMTNFTINDTDGLRSSKLSLADESRKVWFAKIFYYDTPLRYVHHVIYGIGMQENKYKLCIKAIDKCYNYQNKCVSFYIDR